MWSKITWSNPPPKHAKEVVIFFTVDDGNNEPTVRIKADCSFEELLFLFGRWSQHVQYHPAKELKPNPTRGNVFCIGLYFYNNEHPVEVRSDIGDDTRRDEYIRKTLDMLFFGEAKLA